SGDYAYIGRQYGDYDDRYWKGAVDDVKIFYRGLSEQEISGL
ncbi:MAG: LamG domain-containing protein, partial [Planctomycetes bacterium]|nr:LamG domain-containing protein [Planctomycetota bacterium]